MYILLACIAFVILLYIWSVMGRKKGLMKPFYGFLYAHRGLHDEEKPENSMAAFRAALDHGYGIELDIHLLSDGNLAVIHDSSLERVTGQTGFVEELTTQQLVDYRLNGTQETIPQFQQVLDLFAGKAPLIVELKVHENNVAPLCEAACAMLDRYEGLYCVESFDPRVVRWLRNNRPDIARGQLTENWMPKKLPYPAILKWMMTHHLVNFFTRPDFLAYKFEDRKTFSNWFCRKVLRIPCVSWTLKSRYQFETAVKEGWIPIFEGFRI